MLKTSIESLQYCQTNLIKVLRSKCSEIPNRKEHGVSGIFPQLLKKNICSLLCNASHKKQAKCVSECHSAFSLYRKENLHLIVELCANYLILYIEAKNFLHEKILLIYATHTCCIDEKTYTRLLADIKHFIFQLYSLPYVECAL